MKDSNNNILISKIEDHWSKYLNWLGFVFNVVYVPLGVLSCDNVSFESTLRRTSIPTLLYGMLANAVTLAV